MAPSTYYAAKRREVEPSARARRDAVLLPILLALWAALTNDCDYDDLGGDYFTRRAHPDRHRDRLIAQLHDLGYQVNLTKVA